MLLLETVKAENVTCCEYIKRNHYIIINITIIIINSSAGSGTNLKVGEPVQRESRGRVPPLFLALKVQLVVLMSAFVMVSTVWWFLIGCSSTQCAPVTSHL